MRTRCGSSGPRAGEHRLLHRQPPRGKSCLDELVFGSHAEPVLCVHVGTKFRGRQQGDFTKTRRKIAQSVKGGLGIRPVAGAQSSMTTKPTPGSDVAACWSDFVTKSILPTKFMA